MQERIHSYKTFQNTHEKVNLASADNAELRPIFGTYQVANYSKLDQGQEWVSSDTDRYFKKKK